MTVHTFRDDCIQVMREMEPQSIDAVITDPPYGITSLVWDESVEGWLDEVSRILKPSGSVWMFCSVRSLVAMKRELDGWTIAQDVVWKKQNGSGFHADRFKRVHEVVVQIYRGSWAGIYREPQFTLDATARTVRRKARPPHMGHIERGEYVSIDGGPRLMRSVMKVRNCHGSAVHPTQKPVDILVPLIRYSCPLGGTVLDPFMGSGSTGMACVQTGRGFIGVELDAGYYAAALQRLTAVPLPLSMGEAV